MKKYFSSKFIVLTIVTLFSCSNTQDGSTSLDPKAFSDKLVALPNAQLIDVRTPEEYAKGHLLESTNINWNGDNFEKEISTLDKTKPVFVYCLSGGRSSSAASKMRSLGFKEVYELDGGITKWRSEGFPETKGESSTPKGMTMEQFNSLANSDKLVLIDFSATWCGPCKKMKPHLDELEVEMKDKLLVYTIDVDENSALAAELKIDAVPTLMLFKNKKLAWTDKGYFSKEDLIARLK